MYKKRSDMNCIGAGAGFGDRTERSLCVCMRAQERMCMCACVCLVLCLFACMHCSKCGKIFFPLSFCLRILQFGYVLLLDFEPLTC